MNNARIHMTDKIVKIIKEHKLVVFTIPPYSPELNKIENTFGRLKNRISFQNLNSKDFKHVITIFEIIFEIIQYIFNIVFIY